MQSFYCSKLSFRLAIYIAYVIYYPPNYFLHPQDLVFQFGKKRKSDHDSGRFTCNLSRVMESSPKSKETNNYTRKRRKLKDESLRRIELGNLVRRLNILRGGSEETRFNNYEIERKKKTKIGREKKMEFFNGCKCFVLASEK